MSGKWAGYCPVCHQVTALTAIESEEYFKVMRIPQELCAHCYPRNADKAAIEKLIEETKPK